MKLNIDEAVRIDSDIENHIKRLNFDGFNPSNPSLRSRVTIADEKTMELFEQIKSAVKENGASYDQARKALIMVGESFYQNLLKKENPFKEKQVEPTNNEPKKEEEAIRVTREDLKRVELTIDPELPEKLKKELCELSKEFFNKVLAIKKELLPSMKEEELVFLHKKLVEFRRGIPSDEHDANFYIGQIMTDAILIVFADDDLKFFD
ncbi:hypothetical protein [Enterococcus mundtii]|uniref:hypothetical protein n=1 Tax=Enterococcus mundtii TaxID=53346 RepID=UPI00032E4AFE|nr:hypothetical protein [Enterococcus mundtii]EOH58837.1 hypothetical protein UAC_02976 [Enterococcus mundtii ATCC 882]EOU13660.1 hypothetical protein I587_02214 [Enterococcus mundtii ATCC 882]PJK26534.1 hypothetical protein CV769_04155 [Enterococcus mundtii]